MGIALAVNVIIIMHKAKHGRLSDAILDATVLVVLGFVFMGTISGLSVATIGSLVVSGYLYLNPPPRVFETIIEDIDKKQKKKKKKNKKKG